MPGDETKITCNGCGHAIEDNNVSQEKSPCPNCGSILRNISVHIEETVVCNNGFKDSITGVANNSLLLQSLVIPEEKISEGLLIKAVSLPWFDIIDWIKKDLGIIFQLSPGKWEEIIAGAYAQAGFDKVIFTPRSGDHGRDVIAIKKGLGEVRIIDQVKAYKPGHLVTANDVRALMGVLMVHLKVS